MKLYHGTDLESAINIEKNGIDLKVCLLKSFADFLKNGVILSIAKEIKV